MMQELEKLTQKNEAYKAFNNPEAFEIFKACKEIESKYQSDLISTESSFVSFDEINTESPPKEK